MTETERQSTGARSVNNRRKHLNELLDDGHAARPEIAISDIVTEVFSNMYMRAVTVTGADSIQRLHSYESKCHLLCVETTKRIRFCPSASGQAIVRRPVRLSLLRAGHVNVEPFFVCGSIDDANIHSSAI